MRVLLVSFFSLISIVVSQTEGPVGDQRQSPLRHYQDKIKESENILNHLKPHAPDAALNEAYRNVQGFAVRHGQEDWETISVQALSIKLRILSLAYSYRDHSYDLSKERSGFSLSVAPPLGSAPVITSGMDPDLIKDPEIRKQYRLKISENEARKAKYHREHILQRIIDDSITDTIEMRQYLFNARLTDFHRILNRVISDKKLRACLLTDK